MDERTAVVNIGGTEYEMLLTTRATKEIAGRYGGLENLGEKLMKSENFEMALDEIIWLITLLCNQPILIHNLKNPNEKKPELTADEVELLTSPMELTDYKDVVADVMEYFVKFSKKAAEAGIKNWILDPGFGFSKTVNQNWELLRGLHVIKTVENAYGNTPPLLVGMSRKSMIYRLLDITPEESLPATLVAHYAALCGGADILRVHDVAEAVRTVKLYRNLSRENLL